MKSNMNVCRRAIGLASSIPFILLVTILAALQVHADFVPDHAGLSGIHGWIAELGDFDSDKHTDMFVVREEKNENTGAFLRAHIDVYLYRSPGYTKLPLPTNLTFNSPVVGVIANDFNYDGKLDILVATLADPPTRWTSSLPRGLVQSPLSLSIHPGFHNHFSPHSLSLPGKFTDFPALIDANNDLKTDLLAQQLSSDNIRSHLQATESWSSSSTTPRQLWVWTKNDERMLPVYTVTEMTLPSVFSYSPSLTLDDTSDGFVYGPMLPSLNPEMRAPQSVHTTDVDGDCMSDLLIVSKATEQVRETARSQIRDALLLQNPGVTEEDINALVPDSVLEIWINTKDAYTPVTTAPSVNESPLHRILSKETNIDHVHSSPSSISDHAHPGNGSPRSHPESNNVLLGDANASPMFYRLHSSYLLPPGSGQLSTSDLDSDGTVDIVVPACVSSSSSTNARLLTCDLRNQVHIFYNKQMRMCDSFLNPGSNCRKQQELCVSDPHFTFGNITDVSLTYYATHFPSAPRKPQSSSLHDIRPVNPLHVMIDTDQFIAYGRMLAHFAPVITPNSHMNTNLNTSSDVSANVIQPKLNRPPLTLRTGDGSLDGFTDLLMPVIFALRETSVPTPADSEDLPRAELWINVPCNPSLCTGEATNGGLVRHPILVHPDAMQCRTFVPSGYSSITTYKGIIASTFIDVGNQGGLDVLMIADNEFDSPNAFVLRTTVDEDAYFLTTQASNGVCPAWCKAPDPEFPRPRPYGVNFHGGVFKFTVTAVDGTKFPRIAVALTQSGNLALQTPYTLTGLGRTSNYIEELFAGFTIANYAHYNLYIAIIPKSQIVVFPYPISDASAWLIELFISPSSVLIGVLITISVSLFIVGVSILFFHIREQREDEREKKAQRHLFNF